MNENNINAIYLSYNEIDHYIDKPPEAGKANIIYVTICYSQGLFYRTP